MRYYLDCEFDGHNGPLLSMALVPERGASIHIKTNEVASDDWVINNVVPLLDDHGATISAKVDTNAVGNKLVSFFLRHEDLRPTIVADSTVDLARFCNALSTNEDGGYNPAPFSRVELLAVDMDAYPTTLAGAVQHNAWWDAMALREKLSIAHTQPELH